MRSRFRNTPRISAVAFLLVPLAVACESDSIGGKKEPAPIATITLVLSSGSIPAGEPTPLTVIAKDEDGNVLTGRSFVFSSVSEQIAKVSADGVVTGGIPGSTAIIAAAEGKTGTTMVTVVPGAAVQISIHPAAIALYPTASAQFTATVKDKVGNNVSPAGIAWSSSNTSIVTVDSVGIARGITGSGAITITARIGGVSANATARLVSAQQISAGASHSCFLDTDGAAFCWGSNGVFETGTTLPSPVLQPRPVTGNLRFQSISAGGSHTCALTPSGKAYCWGSNARGSLGDGSVTDRSEPVAVKTSASFATISTGWDHTCAQTSAGDMYCCVVQNYSATPELSFNAPLFDMLYAGANLTCGLKDGVASCWGSNNHGQLGTGDPKNSLTPRLVAGGLKFIAIEGYQEVTCGIATDHTLYCWGPSFFGGCNDCGSVPEAGTTNLPFATLSIGFSFFCGTDPENVAYCFGRNEFGKLGIGTSQVIFVPTRIQSPPSGDTKFTSISAGANHACAIGASKAPYCWGRGMAIGTGALQDRNVPTLITPPEF